MPCAESHYCRNVGCGTRNEYLRHGAQPLDHLDGGGGRGRRKHATINDNRPTTMTMYVEDEEDKERRTKEEVG